MSETKVLFNPLEPGFADDPYPAYRRMREIDPVHQHPFGFWILTEYQDVAALLRAGLSVDDRLVSGGQVRAQYDQLDTDDMNVLNLCMLDVDPPDHTRLRTLVTKVFTPRSVAALEPEVTRLVDVSLDRIEDAGRADLVEELAFQLPFTMISRMLGMPPHDHVRIRELSATIVRSLEAVSDQEVLRAINDAGVEITSLIRQLVAWKRANPGEDLLTALIAAENDGDKLSDDEIVAQVALLYMAGHETTANLISNSAVALLRNPDQLALLRERPEIAGNAIEELLRYDSPVQQARRVTTKPYSVRGKEIPAGTFVLACLASANRDRRFWGPDADELRLDRANARRHVSFGAGPHHCLGSSLARLEGRVVIQRLVSRFPKLEFDGEVKWNGRINLRGPAMIPIAV
ncbi:cytochrome P450 [Amycolatopsis sp. NPDC051071]|uniref:cytochrome P450 n=1 Tax=Amycolatopsis sp. NPDC051071 TaxID=3154637 RepID=UPI003432A1E7